tara:strand:- start:935 stop:1156 length:222 start_codon:yes stop_codon:yes gene_type:complete
MKKTIIFLIKVYQITLSPLLGSNCRFQPTCSQYMIEAINHHGVFRGVGLGIKRISKCHPLGSKGYDPVPKKEK